MSNLSPEHGALVKRLEEAAAALAEEGFFVFTHAALYESATSAHFSTGITTPSAGGDIDHAMCDAIRDLSVEWNNMRHTSRLQWVDKEND